MQFAKTSKSAQFSTSVVDIFTQLNQCLDVLKKLDCPDRDVYNNFLFRYAQVIISHIDSLKF